MSSPFKEVSERLQDRLGDLPTSTNKLRDMFDGHATKTGSNRSDFDSTDVDASSRAQSSGSSNGGRRDGDGDADGTQTDLTQEEKDAILDYTGSSAQAVNGRLRDGQTGDPFMASLDDLSDTLSSALAKLPDHQGVTYRGTGLSPEILDRIQPGGTFTDAGFGSSSIDVNVAMERASWAETPVLFTIDGKSGKDITDLSSNHAEVEVLFDKGTTFDVVSKSPDGHGGWNIHLRER